MLWPIETWLQISLVNFVCYWFFSSIMMWLLKKSSKFRIRIFGIGCWIRWVKSFCPSTFWYSYLWKKWSLYIYYFPFTHHGNYMSFLGLIPTEHNYSRETPELLCLLLHEEIRNYTVKYKSAVLFLIVFSSNRRLPSNR